MASVLVFVVIGLLTGAAARLFYPGRQPSRILGTVALGLVGALCGGLFSWIFWPPVDAELQFGNFLVALLGAMLVIVIWAGVTYARSLNAAASTSA